MDAYSGGETKAHERNDGQLMLLLTIEIEEEADGRWIAEVTQLPGVMVYGQTPDDAVRKVKSLALQVLAERVATEEFALDAVSFTRSAA